MDLFRATNVSLKFPGEIMRSGTVLFLYLVRMSLIIVHASVLVFLPVWQIVLPTAIAVVGQVVVVSTMHVSYRVFCSPCAQVGAVAGGVITSHIVPCLGPRTNPVVLSRKNIVYPVPGVASGGGKLAPPDVIEPLNEKQFCVSKTAPKGSTSVYRDPTPVSA